MPMLIINVILDDTLTSSVRIENGRVAEISAELQPRPKEEVLDGTGCFLLPGAVDMHVHGRSPGAEHKEDYEHLFSAALAGGVTSLALMPNTDPPLETVERIEKQLEAAKEADSEFRVYVNAGISEKRFNELKNCLALERVKAIKLYGAGTTGTGGLSTPADIKKVLSIAMDRDVPVMVHAQDETMIEAGRNKLGGGTSASDHADIQTAECELAAIHRFIELAEETGARIIICHVSTADGLEIIADWNAKNGKRVYAEVAPHYWKMDRSWLELSDGTLFLMNPSLREPEQRERLEKMLLDPELVDYVASDHAPHLLSEKQLPYPHAPSGVPGVQTMLPLLWDSGRSLGMTLKRFRELTVSRAVEIYGLDSPTEVAVGERADLILFDPSAENELLSSDQKSKCGWTPYDGWRVIGEVKAVFRAGKLRYGSPRHSVRERT